MIPTHFWYRAESGRTVTPGDASCWLCGCSCPAGSTPVATAIRPTFTNHDRAACRESSVVCDACAAYLDYKFGRPDQERAMGLYTKSLIVWPEKWGEWEREQHADDLLEWCTSGLPADCILALNYSKQKHIIPWAHVNIAGTRRPWVSTDQGAIRLPADFPVVLETFARLWARGYPKKLLARGELGAWQLARSDDPARDLMAFRSIAHYFGAPVLDLVSYVLTEANRDRLAGIDSAVLGRTQPLSAASG